MACATSSWWSLERFTVEFLILLFVEVDLLRVDTGVCETWSRYWSTNKCHFEWFSWNLNYLWCIKKVVRIKPTVQTFWISVTCFAHKRTQNKIQENHHGGSLWTFFTMNSCHVLFVNLAWCGMHVSSDSSTVYGWSSCTCVPILADSKTCRFDLTDMTKMICLNEIVSGKEMLNLECYKNPLQVAWVHGLSPVHISDHLVQVSI